MDLQTYLQWARRCPEEARAQMEYERDCARRAALAAKRPRNKKNAHFVQSLEYRGVFWSHTTREWVARILVDGKFHVMGSYHTEIDAAKAYDMAAEEHESDPVLNFVDGSLNHKRFAGMERQLWRTPSPVVQAEQQEGGTVPPQFEGMEYNAAARQWGVTGGREQRPAGSFNNENQTENAQTSPPAMAPPQQPQQHAMMSPPPPPTAAGPSHTPADERSSEGGGLARAEEGKEKKAGRSKNKSMYRGVSWNAQVKKWSAVKRTKDGLSKHLGCYQDELDAALAYDRAAAEEDENPILNFLPDGRLNPHRRMRMDTYLRRLSEGKVQPGVDDEMSRKSQYRGVAWRPLLKKWVSELVLLDGRTLCLGMFDDERAAARAYDRTARLHGRPLSQLNFPKDESSRETTATATTSSSNNKRRRAGKDANHEEKREAGQCEEEGKRRGGVGAGAVVKEGGRQRPASTLPPSVVDQPPTRPRSKRGRHDPSAAQDEEEGDVFVPSVWPVGGGEGQRAGSAGPPPEGRGGGKGAVGRRDDVAARPPSSAASRLRPSMGEAEEKEEEEEERPAAEEDVAMTLCAFRHFVRL